jgi:malate dehydrogenase (oxaloacetate-decarboxylating)
MAIACAHSIADYSERKGIDPEHIVVTMEDEDVFACEAADVAMKAIEEGVARLNLSWQEVHDLAAADIKASRGVTKLLMDTGHIPEPPPEMLEEALRHACEEVRSKR